MPSGQGRQARLPFLARRVRAQSLALATEFWEIAQARQDNVGGDAMELYAILRIAQTGKSARLVNFTFPDRRKN